MVDCPITDRLPLTRECVPVRFLLSHVIRELTGPLVFLQLIHPSFKTRTPEPQVAVHSQEWQWNRHSSLTALPRHFPHLPLAHLQECGCLLYVENLSLDCGCCVQFVFECLRVTGLPSHAAMSANLLPLTAVRVNLPNGTERSDCIMPLLPAAVKDFQSRNVYGYAQLPINSFAVDHGCSKDTHGYKTDRCGVRC